MEVLTIEQQIKVVENAKAGLKLNPSSKEGLCTHLIYRLNNVLLDDKIWTSYEVKYYIPLFTKENATILARKYKFKKPYESGAYWWNTPLSFFEGRKSYYDIKNRICFLNALIKELKTLL